MAGYCSLLVNGFERLTQFSSREYVHIWVNGVSSLIVVRKSTATAPTMTIVMAMTIAITTAATANGT